jgi:hypothetical protein
LCADGLSDYQIEVPSSDSRHADAGGGFGLFDLPVPPYIVVPSVVAEGALTLWLLAMGVNNIPWTQQNERGNPSSIGKRFGEVD